MLKQEGGGTICNVADAGGLVAAPNRAIYAASKHAVVGLTKTAAVEYAKSGIRVNSLCPGAVKTPMLVRMLEREPGRDKKLKAAHPMGRVAEPAEVASAALWLCSEQASFVTGHQLAVDGGLTAM
jgi:NAD(P)-dependent dehydrogenase (short-subunit alcohol dehydrogenase family)